MFVRRCVCYWSRAPVAQTTQAQCEWRWAQGLPQPSPICIHTHLLLSPLSSCTCLIHYKHPHINTHRRTLVSPPLPPSKRGLLSMDLALRVKRNLTPFLYTSMLIYSSGIKEQQLITKDKAAANEWGTVVETELDKSVRMQFLMRRRGGERWGKDEPWGHEGAVFLAQDTLLFDWQQSTCLDSEWPFLLAWNVPVLFLLNSVTFYFCSNNDSST